MKFAFFYFFLISLPDKDCFIYMRPSKKKLCLRLTAWGKSSSPGRPEIFFFSPQKTQQYGKSQCDYALANDNQQGYKVRKQRGMCGAEISIVPMQTYFLQLQTNIYWLFQDTKLDRLFGKKYNIYS